MALPSPVADFPDMSATIAAAQARAQALAGSAWAGFGSLGERPAPPQAAAPAGDYSSLADYLGNTSTAPGGPRQGASSPSGIEVYGTLPGGRDLLAQTIQGEAGGEGYEGMLAVGSVIGNRVRSGKYGGSTLDDVIMAPGQFSMWNGVTGYAGGQGAIDPSTIRPTEDALRVADLIIAGGYSDPTGGATHYYNPNGANPEWGQARAGGQWQPIGNHLFGWADGRPGAHPKARG